MVGEQELVRKFFPATPYDVGMMEQTLFDPKAPHAGGCVDPGGLTIHFMNSWNNPDRIEGHYSLVTSAIIETTQTSTFKFRQMFCFYDAHNDHCFC